MTRIRIGNVQRGDVFAPFQIGSQHIPIGWEQRKDRTPDPAASPGQHYPSIHC
jgi:hypothetical protein